MEESDRLGDRPPARISPSGMVVDSLVSPGCVIEGEVVCSVLSPGVHVKRGARVTASVVMHDTEIGEGTTVDRAIVDKKVRIGGGSVVGHGEEAPPNRESPEHLFTGLTLIGKLAVVPSGCRIGRNVILHPGLAESHFPGKRIEPGVTLRCD